MNDINDIFHGPHGQAAWTLTLPLAPWLPRRRLAAGHLHDRGYGADPLVVASASANRHCAAADCHQPGCLITPSRDMLPSCRNPPLDA